eukprot:COSAG01_NODE_8328_length_2827_cov_4.134164_3_plen_199_part_00
MLKRELIRNTFFREFVPVDGMAEIYRRWQHQFAASFHFVSASPWQLQPELQDFARSQGFPPASYHLKSVRFNSLPGSGESLLSLFEKGSVRLCAAAESGEAAELPPPTPRNQLIRLLAPSCVALLHAQRECARAHARDAGVQTPPHRAAAAGVSCAPFLAGRRLGGGVSLAARARPPPGPHEREREAHQPFPRAWARA